MGQFEIPGFSPYKTTNDQATLNDKLQADSRPQEGLRAGFERIPTQLPGDRWNPDEVTAYRTNSGLVAMYKQAKESVAYIESENDQAPPPGQRKLPTTGSGFIATADGRVVTSSHVIKDTVAGTLKVTLPTGKKYDADVEYVDQKTELAVLRLHRQAGETFKPLAMADSSELKPGDRVAALGYPRGVREVFMSVGGRWQQPSAFESPSQFGQDKMFVAADGSGFQPGGFRGKMTIGQMLFDKSGKERLQGGLLPGEDPNRSVIATDLKVEPGNSGGPLLNQEFKAIGVVDITDVKGSKAISTPIEDVKKMLAESHVLERPNVPFAPPKTNSIFNPTSLFPFLQPVQDNSRTLMNRINTVPDSNSLQYRLKEKLAPYLGR